jgi:AcrR family transcriptional regulator
VVRSAATLADREGLDALTMRRLGSELGVEAMSLYKHVPSKDQLLDDLVELVFGEIEVPESAGTDDWKHAMRVRARSARAVLGRHAWAIGLLESRGVKGSASAGYVDATLGALRSGGFSIENAAHAFWLLDSFVYGHVLQEVSTAAQERRTLESPATVGRHLAELVATARAGQFSPDGEFDFGLELILTGLEQFAEPAAAG